MKNKIARTLCLSLLVVSLASASAFAQASNGAGAGKPVVSVSYYKLPPGRQDEWLALYKKYHLPIMKYRERAWPGHQRNRIHARDPSAQPVVGYRDHYRRASAGKEAESGENTGRADPQSFRRSRRLREGRKSSLGHDPGALGRTMDRSRH